MLEVMVENSFILNEFSFSFFFARASSLCSKNKKQQQIPMRASSFFFAFPFAIYWCVYECSTTCYITLYNRFFLCELTKAQTKKESTFYCVNENGTQKILLRFLYLFPCLCMKWKKTAFIHLHKDVHHVCYRFNVSFFYLCLSLFQNVFCISTYSTIRAYDLLTLKTFLHEHIRTVNVV